MLSFFTAAAISAGCLAGMAVTASAATVSDLTAVSGNATYYFSDYTSNGTTPISSGVLFADNHLIGASSSLTVATNKGNSTVNGGSYLNCLRVKNNVNLVFKTASACTVTVYGQGHSERTLRVGTSDKGNDIYYDATNLNSGVFSFEISAENANKPIYIVSWDTTKDDTQTGGADLYLAAIDFSFSSSPTESTDPSETETANPDAPTSQNVTIKGNAGVKSVTFTAEDNSETTLTWQRDGYNEASLNDANGGENYNQTDDKRNYYKTVELPLGTYTVSAMAVSPYYVIGDYPATLTVGETAPEFPALTLTASKATLTGTINYEKLWGKTITFDFTTKTGEPNEYLALQNNDAALVYSTEYTDDMFIEVDTKKYYSSNFTKEDGTYVSGGKFNSIDRSGDIQCNIGTVIYVPMNTGSVVDFGGKSFSVVNGDGTVKSGLTSYTYEGETSKFVEFVCDTGNQYLSTITIITGEKPAEPTAPSFSVNLGTGTVYKGTSDKQDTVATAYIAEIGNSGARGTISSFKVTVDDKTPQTASFNVVTLDGGANAYIGLILENVDAETQTVSASIE